MATSKKREGGRKREKKKLAGDALHYIRTARMLLSCVGRPPPLLHPVRTCDELAHAHANLLDASDAYVYL